MVSERWKTILNLDAGHSFRTRWRTSSSSWHVRRPNSAASDGGVGGDSQVSSEQARWAEINQRLEELDRVLARR